MLLTRAGPLVVDVKPSRRLENPEVAFTFAWTRQVVQDRGWGYQVLSEPEPALLENVRFLAGYRRDWLFPADLLEAADGAIVDGMALGEAIGAVGGFAPELVRAGVFHLLWSGRFTTDLRQPLAPAHVLWRPA
ncbi:TnsA-like heteromeric transposase endonuclease subunit [Streptomyces sp. KMM 9044]|nr:TnsA-like heteromeric transposase endonuclease subunit [Streptomyces sp. KMM 9044]WAX81923.1 TnsA-like heteromeric transposase endonuclease subunit [Streptomyces sp. KMM 9044]